MTRPYCTLFNALYVVRGLALHASLARHDPDFRLYVFAMDEVTARIMGALGDPRVVVVRAAEFEDEELLAVKQTRSIAEYYWTCTPSIIRHCLLAHGESECTYVDADIWFLSNPTPLFAEMGSASVLLTEHRFAPRHEQSAAHGRYCVQFMRFVHDMDGMRALEWWRDRCIEWCFAREENGKFGDQKYLDDWPLRFPGVHVLQNPGGGLAPWNVTNLPLREQAGRPVLQVPGGQTIPVVFYHFHGLRSYSPEWACLGYGYRLPRPAKRLIYFPYLRELLALYLRHRNALEGIAASGPAPASSSRARALLRWIKYLWGLPNTHRITLDSH